MLVNLFDYYSMTYSCCNGPLQHALLIVLVWPDNYLPAMLA